mmetsp:Transcript_27562/g.54035  ORF Transcript_27562/g.54035 Transcript_27562/m.54035 type:complete len:250 (-) Transcript_27562:168-917(-)
MQNAVCILNLGFQGMGLLFVHLPDLTPLPLVCLLKMLKLLLQVFELPGETLILQSELGVFFLVPFVKVGVTLNEMTVCAPELAQSILVVRLDDRVFLVTLCKHLVVVLQLCLVELIRGYHLFMVLLKFLDALFHLDLALIVFVRITCSQLLNLHLKLPLSLLAFFQEFSLFHLAAFLEKPFNLILIGFHEIFTLLLEGCLNFLKLLIVPTSHCMILLAHFCDEASDVPTLLFQRPDVFLIFIFQLCFEV